MSQISTQSMYSYLPDRCQTAHYSSAALEYVGVQASLFGSYEIGLPALAAGKSVKIITDVTCNQFALVDAVFNNALSDFINLAHITASYYIHKGDKTEKSFSHQKSKKMTLNKK